MDDRYTGASPARSEYLNMRIHRVLGEYAARIVEARLSLSPARGDPSSVEAVIRCDLVEGSTIEVAFVRRSLPLALASVFEGVAYRLRVEHPPRTGRGRFGLRAQ